MVPKTGSVEIQLCSLMMCICVAMVLPAVAATVYTAYSEDLTDSDCCAALTVSRHSALPCLSADLIEQQHCRER